MVGDEEAELRGWKLFALIPTMLLHKTRASGSVGRDEFAHQVEDFNGGKWNLLISQAKQHCVHVQRVPRTVETYAESRLFEYRSDP